MKETDVATLDEAARKEHVSTEQPIPMASDEPTESYSMLEPRMKKVYGAYYKELYYTPERRVLDPKVQELISLAASLVAKCEGCIDGHMKKALSLGATKEEISETICIAAAINAAAVVDHSDRTAARLGLNHFPTPRPRKD
ncbi:MAG TPA: carboxymuconolactone decarboxylase family protein [Pyrinomonadaceae bacterium]|jgi:AhpD family alkylhydroperoxidase|nr:carboxymuconolactone decarboxylase family protein [Pyrinomonadaceae bacterium]